MANVYLKTGRFSHEKNDCSVIALAYAWDMEYQHAHDICKKAGRKDAQGFNLFHELFRVGPLKKYRQFKNRGVSWHKRPGMSVGKFADTHKSGIYIVHVTGHVFTIIDGRVLNQSSARSHVDEYCYISPDFNSPKPETFIKILRTSKIECDKGHRIVFNVVRNGIEYNLELDGNKYPGLYDNPVAASAVVNRIPDVDRFMEEVDSEEEEETLVELLDKVMDLKVEHGLPDHDWIVKYPDMPREVRELCMEEGYEVIGEDALQTVENKAVFSTTQFYEYSWVYTYRGEYGYPGWVAYFEKLIHKKDRKPPTKVYRIRKVKR